MSRAKSDAHILTYIHPPAASPTYPLRTNHISGAIEGGFTATSTNPTIAPAGGREDRWIERYVGMYLCSLTSKHACMPAAHTTVQWVPGLAPKRNGGEGRRKECFGADIYLSRWLLPPELQEGKYISYNKYVLRYYCQSLSAHADTQIASQ